MKQSKTTNRLADGSMRKYRIPSSKRFMVAATLLVLHLFLLTNLSACKTTDTIVKTEYVNIYHTEYVYPSEALLTPCPQQGKLSFTTNGEILMSLIELTTKYAICSARMTAIIQYVDSVKAANGIDVEKKHTETGASESTEITDNQSSDEQNLKVE